MILCCGEALLDVFSTARRDGAAIDMTAVAGGSPFNVAIGIARLGVAAGFLSRLSTDAFGRFLVATLTREGVDVSLLRRSCAPTTLAFVSTGEDGVPEYGFLGEGAADRSLAAADLPAALGDTVAALHFGSYSLHVGESAEAYSSLIWRESRRRAVAIDVNIRPQVLSDMAVWRRRIEDLAPHASMLKASSEDIGHLYGTTDLRGTAERWRDLGATLVLVTDGGRGAHALAGDRWLHAPARAVAVVDTVGAGDSFQAAMLAGLHAKDMLVRDRIAVADPEVLAETLRHAVHTAAITCSRRGADLPRRTELEDRSAMTTLPETGRS